MDCKHSADVNRRLARISGQVNGIREMVNEGRPCDELLIQLSSVSSAVTQVAARLEEAIDQFAKLK